MRHQGSAAVSCTNVLRNGARPKVTKICEGDLNLDGARDWTCPPTIFRFTLKICVGSPPSLRKSSRFSTLREMLVRIPRRSFLRVQVQFLARYQSSDPKTSLFYVNLRKRPEQIEAPRKCSRELYECTAERGATEGNENMRRGSELRWCSGLDLNQHRVTPTRPSNVRVYQFATKGSELRSTGVIKYMKFG